MNVAYKTPLSLSGLIYENTSKSYEIKIMILQIFITIYMDSDEAIRNMDYISEEIIIHHLSYALWSLGSGIYPKKLLVDFIFRGTKHH